LEHSSEKLIENNTLLQMTRRSSEVLTLQNCCERISADRIWNVVNSLRWDISLLSSY